MKLTLLIYVRSEEDDPLGPTPLDIYLLYYLLRGLFPCFLLLERISIKEWGSSPTQRLKFLPPQCVSVITIKSTRVFKPRHAEGSFLPFHESFWRLGTRTSSLNALDRVTLQTSNGGTLIQRFRFYLEYLGGIASPSFFVSTVKASRCYSFHFSSEFAISECSYLRIHHTFTKETSKILQRQEDQFASHPT